jgi:hypothetical protein
MTRNILVIDSRPFGLFSIFLHTIDCLKWAETNNYIPLIRWGRGRYDTNLHRLGAREALSLNNPSLILDKNNFVTDTSKFNNAGKCLYLDKDEDNPWEYYFESINPLGVETIESLPEEDNIRTSDIFMCGELDFDLGNKFLIRNLHSYDSLKLWHLETPQQVYQHRKEIHTFIKEHVKIKQEILKKVQLFRDKTMQNSEILIGVHIRGTDKKTEFPFRQLTIQDYINKISNCIQNAQNKKYKIYVASDTNEAIIEIIKKFGRENVVSYPCIRMPNYNGNMPIHLSTNINKKQHGEETLIEMLLLSGCNVIIGTDSNLTATASYYNPEAELVYLDRKMGS